MMFYSLDSCFRRSDGKGAGVTDRGASNKRECGNNEEKTAMTWKNRADNKKQECVEK